MPLVKISLLKGKDPEYKRALLDGVHSALVESFLIPDSDRMQMIYELDNESFDIPLDKTDQFLIIEIVAFQGRSFDAKKKLYRSVIEKLSRSPGITGDDILIILHEPPKENWGIRGGRPASEVDLGFKVEV
jgi:phenylpyruvate tautomerase PptA (4-oxalocrotonate tautomerase family)